MLLFTILRLFPQSNSKTSDKRRFCSSSTFGREFNNTEHGCPHTDSFNIQQHTVEKTKRDEKRDRENLSSILGALQQWWMVSTTPSQQQQQ